MEGISFATYQNDQNFSRKIWEQGENKTKKYNKEKEQLRIDIGSWELFFLIFIIKQNYQKKYLVIIFYAVLVFPLL